MARNTKEYNDAYYAKKKQKRIEEHKQKREEYRNCRTIHGKAPRSMLR